MTGRLEGKAALVTGAARGIGAATCERLAREGAAVLAADVRIEEAEALAARLAGEGGRVRAVRLDVASEAEWSGAVAAAREAFGGLHVLVNNAGIARIEDVETETREGYEALIAVNQTGAWLGMRAAVPALRDSGGGSIVNVSSIYGTCGGNGTAIAYHASKGALRLMTKNAALRYAGERIRVNSVHPGFIETPMIQPFLERDDPSARRVHEFILSRTPMGRMGRAEEVASVIAFLACDDASYVTGSEVYVDGGWTAA